MIATGLGLDLDQPQAGPGRSRKGYGMALHYSFDRIPPAVYEAMRSILATGPMSYSALRAALGAYRIEASDRGFRDLLAMLREEGFLRKINVAQEHEGGGKLRVFYALVSRTD